MSRQTKKIIYISDFLVEQVIGGAEINDYILIEELFSGQGERYQSHLLTLDFLRENKDSIFIISNFLNLSNECIQFIQDECAYIIYEHDHKYLKSRNPALYDGFKAPKEEIVNYNFYKSARKVIAQSEFHKNIIFNNLGIENLYSVGGNLWTEWFLFYLSDLLNDSKKNGKCFIMDSPIAHKNTSDAVRFCKIKGIPYNLFKSNDNKEFVKILAKHSQFAFFPKTPETFSRVVVEARMLGVKVHTNNLVGATHEPWFNTTKGQELIDLMHSKKQEIKKAIEESYE